MADIDEVLKQAGAIGEQMVKQPRVVAYFDAVRGLLADATARGLLHDYQTRADEMQHKQVEGRPIEVSDKKTLADLESKIASNDVLKKYMQTQADYIELMERVSRALHEPLAKAMPDVGAAL